ncbi:MAG: tRNA dihydrouridine synthase DusB [Pseudomonadota bacterium]
MEETCLKNEHTAPLKIGPVPVRNRAWLAPMSGVTDVPFRQLAWRYGAGMVVSEMVASEALTTGQEEMRLKAEAAGLPTHVVQLAGRDPVWMARATRLAEDAGASVIDINMGCPAKKVVNGYSGSALMRDLDHAMTLIDAVMKTTDLPVTLKMRLGWDDITINAPELAERAERAGVQLITVHGRTRQQFYKGHADWTRIAPVRERISVPLVVNGDVLDEATARAAMKACGADGVMVGRATYGAPWLVGQIGAALAGQPPVKTPTGPALAALVAEHYEAMLSFYGTDLGRRNARKHLDWYCNHIRKGEDFQTLRKAMMTADNPAQVLRIIEVLFADRPAQQDQAA